MSKVGLTAITFVQQRAFDFDTTRNDIVVNSCSPGYVATAMTSFKGVLTVEQGFNIRIITLFSLILFFSYYLRS